MLNPEAQSEKKTCHQIITGIFSSLDPSKQQISRLRSYSSGFGKVLGLLIAVFLLSAFVFKTRKVIGKQTMYLNSFGANDRSPINMSTFYFTLALSDWGNSIEYHNQFEYGLNVTMYETVRNGTDVKSQTVLDDFQTEQSSFYQHILNKEHFDKLKQEKRKGTKAKSYLGSKDQGNSLSIRSFQMIPCEFKANLFCTPAQLAHNLTLSGDYNLGDQLVVDYTIVVKPCNKSISDRCQPPPPDGYVSFFMYKWNRYDIYQRNAQDISKIMDLPVARMSWIADEDNLCEYQSYKIQLVNVTTYNPTFLPELLESFLESVGVVAPRRTFQQFWYYDGEEVVQTHKRKSLDDFYLSVDLKRSRRSESYQQRFVTIDNVIAEVFGISALIGLLVKVLFSGYTKWKADNYIIEQIKDQKINTGKTYLSHLRSQAARLLRRKQDRSNSQQDLVLKQANKNVDIIELTRKLRLIESKVEMLMRDRGLSEQSGTAQPLQQVSQSTLTLQEEKVCILNSSLHEQLVAK